MKKSFLKIVVLLFLVIANMQVFAQAQLAACNNAQNACANPGFSLTSNFGTGLPSGLNVSNPSSNPAGSSWSGCLLSNGPGPNWMIITIGSSGMLGFSFGASSSQPGTFPQSGFYDWAMWPYDPNTTCNAIFNNSLPPAACCWNAQPSGGTGMGVPTPSAVSSTGQSLPAGALGNFVPSIPVTAGQQFIILLSNYSGVTTSVSIASNGSAGLTCSPLLLPSAIRCPSQQAAITATWATSATNITYTIASAMPLSAANMTIQTSPTFIVAPAATHVYTVFASGSNSLSAVVTSSNTFTVTISPTTTMSVSHPDNVCYGDHATFTALSPGTNFTLVSPPPSSTVTSAIQAMTTPTLATGGTYTMGTTLFSGCTATAAVNVNVAPNNTIVVTSPVNTCLNAPVTVLSSSLVSGNGSYSWSGPNFPPPPASDSTVTSYTLGIQGIQLNQGGVYTVKSKIQFGAVGTTQIQCPTSSTVQVNVVATSPVLTSPSRTLCQGTNLNLSSSITGTAGFFWTGPNNFHASAQTTTISPLLPNNAGIYTITAIFSNGFLSCPKTNTVKVDVVATSVPTLTMPHNICQGDVASLSVTANGTPAPTYYWTGPNSFTANIANPVIQNIQPSPSDIYYATAYFTMGTVTCPTSVSGHLNVVQVNTVSVIPPTPVCRPDNVQLNSSANGAISYTWTGPNNFLDHQSNPIIFHPQTTATGIYTVTVAFGGGALTCYNHNTVAVTVNPVLDFSLTAWQQVCYDTPVHIYGPTGATSYSWTSSGGFTSNQQDMFIPAVSVADGGTYTLSLSLGPCTTSQTSVLDVIDKIHQVYYQQSTTICRGDSITLKSEVAGGNGMYYAYTWNPSIYLNSPTGSVQAGVRPQGTTVYNVTIFDTRCPEHKESNTFTVKVLRAAQPDLQLDKNYGCEPFCLTYDSKVDHSHSLVTYDFLGANGWKQRIQNDQFTKCLSAGTYTLKVKTSTLDDESSLVCSDSITYPAPLLVSALPGSDIQWLPEHPTISDNHVTFYSSAKNGVVQNRQWKFAGTYSDTLNLPSEQRVFESTGKYPVMLITTNDMGCTDTIIKYVDVLDDFNVFIPNSFTPNGDGLNDVFQLKGTGIKPEAFSMDIYDRWGLLLFSTNDPSKGWDGNMNGQNQAGEGIYVYKIKLNGANGEGKREYIGQITLIR